jgi:hypothetical protein
MTRDQLEVALAAKQELQKHLDERFRALDNMSDEFKSVGKLTDSLIVGNRAEIYNALSLVCAVDIGTYQGLLLMMQMKDQNNEA